jgi:Holliday junction resolvase RusA-like endonuclease
MSRPIAEVVMLKFPTLISVNALWRPIILKNGKRHYPSMAATPAYKTWKKEAAHIITISKCGRIDGAYSMRIQVPASMKFDLGNTEKALSDALQAAGVISNDKLCQEIHVKRVANLKETIVMLVATKEVKDD